MSLWGVILSLFQCSEGSGYLKITFLLELINADRLTVELDFSVSFQDLKEIRSKPFGLIYYFFCSVTNFPVLLAFFFLGQAL